MRFNIVLLASLLITHVTFSQADRKTIDFHAVVKKAYENPSEPLLIENAIIAEHSDLDDFNNFVEAHKNAQGRIPIKPPITFRNCLLASGIIELNYCDFEQTVLFEFCKSPDDHHLHPLVFTIGDCKFSDLQMLNSECSHLEFYNCQIDQGKFLVENSIIKLINTVCTNILIFENDRETDNQIINIEGSTIPELQIIGDYKRVKIRNSKLQELKISASITQELNIANNVVSKAFYLQHTSLPELSANVKLYWNQLEGYKLRTDFEEEDTKGSVEIDNELEEYEELNSNYQALLKIYKDRGDRTSANACYVELKRLETDMLKQKYAEKPSFETFVKYKLNAFLDTFCEFGTNTVNSIMYSLYVVLIFGIIYVVFPSEKDGLYSSNFFKTIKRLSEYFSKDPDITQKNVDNIGKEIADLTAKKNHYQSIHRQSSLIFKLIGFMFYLPNIIYFNINLRMLCKLQNWESNKGKDRKKIKMLVYSYFVFYFFGALFMRLTNAIALSLNAFITLGYGEISAKGISRYLAVIEGFFGWFLLSIFSVSLLSQILQ
jgi:hypothetical protein